MRKTHKAAKYGSPLHRKRISSSLREYHRSRGRKRKPGKWMSKLRLRKGALHRALGVPLWQKIPASKLDQGLRSSDKRVRREAVLARTFRRYRGVRRRSH